MSLKTTFTKGGLNPQSLDRRVSIKNPHKHSGCSCPPLANTQALSISYSSEGCRRSRAKPDPASTVKMEIWLKTEQKAKASGTELVQSTEFCAELRLIVRFALARFSVNPYIKGQIYILAPITLFPNILTYSCVQQQYAYSNIGILEPEPGPAGIFK